MRFNEFSESKLLDKPTPTINDIIKKFGVGYKYLMHQLQQGIQVELEHTSDIAIAKEIALDHLGETPDYYEKLKQVEEGWKNWAAAGAIGATLAATSGLPGKSPKSPPVSPITKQIKQLSHIEIAEKTKSPHDLAKIALDNNIRGVELAAFLAQCAHESHNFKHMSEIGSHTDFKKYDPRHAPRRAKILGNKHPGDGAKYKGRGYIQLTGRDNYIRAGLALNLPLEANPELAARPDVAAKIAVWYWKNRISPRITNFNDVRAVTKLINPGLRGLEDRKEKFLTIRDMIVPRDQTRAI